MAKMSLYFYAAGSITLGVSTLLYVWYGLRRGWVAGRYATPTAAMAAVFLGLSLLARAVATGHGPFANMYEFSLSFAWGVTLCYLYIERQYRLRELGMLVMPVALVLLLYAGSLPAGMEPLVPALQNNLLLTVHVAVAIIAYGAFGVGFGAGALHLMRGAKAMKWLPPADVLDDMGYRAVILGFPMMALVILLGAVWAYIAWGSYWSWDPKETASLVTWLVYGAYLHTRTMRGWRGTPSALLLIVGFGATLFTFFGNLFFTGLHSYGGV